MRAKFMTAQSLALMAGLSGPASVAAAQEAPQEEFILLSVERSTVVVYDERRPRAEELPLSISSLRQDTLTDIAAVHPAESLNSVSGVNIHPRH